MTGYARRWVQNCPTCASRKHPKYNKRTPLINYRVGATLDRISIDLLGPFRPRTKRGSSVILTITDHYTRWVEAFALRDATAPRIAQCVHEFCCRMGMPLEVHSDQGRNVDGETLREVCKILNLRKTHTLAYHPQGNSITERENAVIKAMLSSYTNSSQNDWDEYLPSVMMAYRSSLHRTLKETPNMMMFGREVRIPLDAMLGRPPEEEYQELPAGEYAAGLIESLQKAHQAVAEAVDQAYRYQKKQYDRHVRSEEYEVGQAVWLREYPYKPGKSKSLRRPYTGPWIVIARYSRATYKIQKTLGSQPRIVHSDRLKRFFGAVTAAGTRSLCKPKTQDPL